MSERWCCFIDGVGMADDARLDGWLRNQNPNARRVSAWEPVSVGVEWVDEATGYSLAESSPAGFQTVILWRCRVEVPHV